MIRLRRDAVTISKADADVEAAIYKRDFSAAQRRQLASEGKALDDGSYPIETAEDLHPAAVLARSGHGNAEGAKSLIARRAKELGVANPLTESAAKSEDMEIEVKLWKSEMVEGKVYGAVLEPDLEDSQGDVVTTEDIEKACHAYMIESRKADRQHDGQVVKADLIENYIAPQDLVIEGEPVRKGAWIQGWLVHDPVLKQEIAERKITGFSIGGSGVREPM